MPSKNNLAFDLGEDWIISLTCHLADGVTPLDLTGASVAMAIKGFAGFAPTITITTPAAGLVTIRATPAQQTSAGITAGQFGYTIRATLGDGTVSDQTAGVLSVRKSEF